MSIRVMADVWDFGPEDATECNILVCLASHANDEGESCFPSIARVSKMARLSERTVQRTIQSLEEGGWICVERGTGRGNVSHYAINVTKLKRCQIVTLYENGDIAERVTSATGKGDIDAIKGDIDAKPPAPPCRSNRHRTVMEPPSAAARVEAKEDDPETVPNLVRQIVCAHPRSRLRCLQPREVSQAQEAAIFEAVQAEIKSAAAVTETQALSLLLERTEMLAENVPRSEWRFFKDVPQFYRSYDYRLEPDDFTKGRSNGKVEPNSSPAVGRVRSSISAFRRAAEQRTGRAVDDTARADGRSMVDPGNSARDSTGAPVGFREAGATVRDRQGTACSSGTADTAGPEIFPSAGSDRRGV